MKIKKINDNMLQVDITFKELEIMNINLKDLINNTDKAKDLLNDILIQSENLYGFTIETELLQVKIQTTISSVRIILEQFENEKIKDNNEKISFKKQDYNEKILKGNMILLSDNLTNIENVCTNIDLKISSTLYKYKKNYYLVLKRIRKQDINYFKNIFSEFLLKQKSPDFLSVLNEYGEILIKTNAIQKMKY